MLTNIEKGTIAVGKADCVSDAACGPYFVSQANSWGTPVSNAPDFPSCANIKDCFIIKLTSNIFKNMYIDKTPTAKPLTVFQNSQKAAHHGVVLTMIDYEGTLEITDNTF